MTRKTLVSFAGIVGMGVIALAGCGSSSGTVGFFGTTKTGTSVAFGGQRTAAPWATTAATPGSAPETAEGTTAEGGGWVLSAPDSIFGFARIQPSTATLDKIQSALTSGDAELGVGVSGTPVIAVYDDPTHDVYLILAGYNGTGFDPSKLTAYYEQPPQQVGEGGSATITQIYTPIDPGAHGGTAGCVSSAAQTAMAASENTICSWMTSTTFGNITYFPKPDHAQLIVGVGADVMGKVMRDLRDLVEHRS